jgi:hypothetical protein
VTCETSDTYERATPFKKLDINNHYSQFNLNTLPDTTEQSIETPPTIPLSSTASTCSCSFSQPDYVVIYQHLHSKICSSPLCHYPNAIHNQKTFLSNNEQHWGPTTYENFMQQQSQTPCYCLHHHRSSFSHKDEDIIKAESMEYQPDCAEKLENESSIPFSSSSSSSPVSCLSPTDKCVPTSRERSITKYLLTNTLKTAKTKQRTTNVIHICPYPDCSKTFTKLSHLRSHEVVHLGLRPFHCTWPSCEWKFARADELKRHFR